MRGSVRLKYGMQTVGGMPRGSALGRGRKFLFQKRLGGVISLVEARRKTRITLFQNKTASGRVGREIEPLLMVIRTPKS